MYTVIKHRLSFFISLYIQYIQAHSAHTYERKVKIKIKTLKNLLDTIVSCREMIHREKGPEDLLAACAAASDRVCIMSGAARISIPLYLCTP